MAIGNWGSSADLYHNHGRGNFARMWSADAPDRRIHYAGAMSSADIDADGDIDIYIGNWPNGPGEGELNDMYWNRNPLDNHWLQVRLVGKGSGIGARVLVTTGGVTQMREVRPHAGFRGHKALAPHFGIGEMKTIAVLEVRWPSGKTSKLKNVKADRLVEVVEPAGD